MTKEDQFIELFTCTKFNPVTATSEDVHIADIAQALALTTRYNGHTVFPYSVAQHSVIMSDWVMGATQDYNLAFSALLHDAHEAYVCDMPRPLKYLFPELEPLALRMDEIIAEAFSVQLYPLPQIVARADRRICHDEKAVLKPSSTTVWKFPEGCAEPLDVFIGEWTWRQARSEFMDRFQILSRKVKNE